MSKLIGFDLGINSTGWATFNPETKRFLASGVRVFPKAQIKRERKDRIMQLFNSSLLVKSTCLRKVISAKPFHYGLAFIGFLTLTLVVINNRNWQFWLNISVMILLALFTSFYQGENKK